MENQILQKSSKFINKFRKTAVTGWHVKCLRFIIALKRFYNNSSFIIILVMLIISN